VLARCAGAALLCGAGAGAAAMLRSTAAGRLQAASKTNAAIRNAIALIIRAQSPGAYDPRQAAAQPCAISSR
jgi:hypothetical protein